MRIVITCGTFDMPHEGHATFLSHCASLVGNNGTLAVLVNRDDFVTRYKGVRPIYSLEERKGVIRHFKGVDTVATNHGDGDLRKGIKYLLGDSTGWDLYNERILVVGSDWLTKDYLRQTKLTPEWLVEHRMILAFAPYTSGVTSTRLRERARNG